MVDRKVESEAQIIMLVGAKPIGWRYKNVLRFWQKQSKECNDLISAGRLFHNCGAAHRKARVPVPILVRGICNKLFFVDRRVRAGL